MKTRMTELFGIKHNTMPATLIRGNFDEKRLLCETIFKCVYLKEGQVSEVELPPLLG